MRKIELSKLVLDFELYPRTTIDSTNVSAMVDAINAGEVLPPILIDKRSKRVVDGFHRVKAYARVHGEDYKAEVVERTFRTEGALVAESIRLNKGHGKRLSVMDRIHCVHLGERVGLTIEKIAACLSVPVDQLGDLVVDRTATCRGSKVTLKPALAKPFRGRSMSAKARAVNDKMNANNARYFSDRLRELIEIDAVDFDEEGLLDSIRSLHAVLSMLLKPKQRAKRRKKSA